MRISHVIILIKFDAISIRASLGRDTNQYIEIGFDTTISNTNLIFVYKNFKHKKVVKAQHYNQHDPTIRIRSNPCNTHSPTFKVAPASRLAKCIPKTETFKLFCQKKQKIKIETFD